MKLHKTDKEGVFYYFTKRKGKQYMYRYRYYNSRGKRSEASKRSFNSLNQAYRALLEIKIQIAKGNTKQLENRNMKVSEWMDIYYDVHKNDWAESTRTGKELFIRRWIKPLIGNLKLREIDDVQYRRDFINVLFEHDLKPKSVKSIHSAFRIAINYAVKKEIINSNSFTSVTIKDDEYLDNFYTGEELISFLGLAKRKVDIPGYTMISLLAYTGARYSEACGLTWKDINFKSGKIIIREQRDRFGVRSLKTKNSRRTIPVDEELLDQLKLYRTWCKKTKKHYKEELKEEDLVLITKNNTPVCESFLMRRFDSIYKKVKMKNITPHGLRHTHATLLLSEKIPVPTVANRLGNTPEMIYRVYGHTFEELDEQCVTAFKNAVGRFKGEVSPKAA